MEILIIAGGTIDVDLLKKLINQNEYYIIGVDGGMNVVDSIELIPNMIIGDFDSINSSIISKYNSLPNTKLLNPIKDYTDTHMAVLEAIKLNPSQITIIGAMGTRLDHVLANLGMLKVGLINNITIKLIDSNNRIQLINKEFKINKSEQYGKYISILPMSDEVMNISLEGFKYSMKEGTIIQGQSIGVSNELEKEEGLITVGKGYLLVMETKD